MAFLVQREYFPDTRKTFYANYQDILQPTNNDVEQEYHRSMTIHYGRHYTFMQPIGKLKSSIYQRLDATTDIYTSLQLSLPINRGILGEQIQLLFGLQKTAEQEDQQTKNKKFEASLDTSTHIGPDHQLKSLDFNFTSGILTIQGKGTVEGREIVLEIKTGDSTIEQKLPLPPDSMIFDPLANPGRFPKLEVGKKFEMRWFDPLTRQSRTAIAEVQSKIDDYMWHNTILPVYVVYTKATPFNITTWVDQNGDVIQYQIFSFIFIKDKDVK